MVFFRQTWTLMSKNFLIVLGRRGFATVFSAFVLPIVLFAFLSFAKNLFVPPAVYGVSSSRPVRSFQDGLAASSNTGRDTVAFVNSGFTDGAIQRVIDDLASTTRSAGKTAAIFQTEDELVRKCRATLRGVTPCYGAVVFHASPQEGKGGLWNYTMRADSALGAGRVNVKSDDNAGQVYILPFQQAVDEAIMATNRSSTTSRRSLTDVHGYPFTGRTQSEQDEYIRVLYQDSIMNFLGVAFISGMIFVSYHMTGFMASETETGMATLIDSMMPTKSPWHAQTVRLLAHHLSFSLIYLPGWVIGSAVLSRSVFATTNAGIVVIYHILTGLSLTSMSILGASFFKKSQLSGATVTIVLLLLAIIAQTVTWPQTATVTILSLLFAPCNYTYFISLLARWEKELIPTNLAKTAPNSPWNLPGIVLWIFLIVQIFAYPLLGAAIERYLHGTTSNARTIVMGEDPGALGPENAIRLEGFTKIYKPGVLRRIFGFILKPKAPVRAVDGLTLNARRGQILALLGANGSGKSTTLDSIAGTTKMTSGKIVIDGTGGIGIAPQKNVLWDDLTVVEHISIFNKLKSPLHHASKDEILELVASVDLKQKIKARSKTLSGGQKRKLQLGMMLTGGSAVCCVDEVSSGIDPLSRRKIWDILLAERGRRTMILTTHFLDEADLLADHIAILSKGTLRAEGSSVELKDKLGKGYRVHLGNAKGRADTPDIDGVTKKTAFDIITYVAPTSGLAAQVIKTLEAQGVDDYSFSGPTIEDVFLQVAEEVRMEASQLDPHPSPNLQSLGDGYSSNEKIDTDEAPSKSDLELMSGQQIGFFRQTWVLFLKRCVVFKGNWFPYAAALLIPILAAGLVSLFVRHQKPPGCSPTDGVSQKIAVDIFSSHFNLFMVGGPSSKLTEQGLIDLFLPIYLNSPRIINDTSDSDNSTRVNPIEIFQNLTIVDTFEDFNRMVELQRKNITPAAFWLGDANSPPTIAYKASAAEVFDAWFAQWVLNMLLSNTSIAATFVSFDIPWSPDMGNSLQLLVYMGLALAAYPGFLALYPNLERRRYVRGLQYSNGVRILPLWLAYMLFDFGIIVVSAAIATALLAGLSKVWYHVSYIFVVFMLYGLASTLFGYVISLFTKSQLSAYAWTALSQAVLMLVYLIAYLCTITYAPVNRVDSYLLLVHFLVSAVAPIGSFMRTMFLALNLFSATCDGDRLAPNPGGILQYGGPILYLLIQSLILFGLLIWFDSGNVGSTFARLFRRNASVDPNGPETQDEEVAHELTRVTSTRDGTSSSVDDGLRVVHLTKRFGSNTAVDNVTFGVKRGEVFALLGPNGAGKSTTISMIRGDVKPSARGGDVFVEDVSVSRHLAQARSNLGVCPQFDAVDQMTVLEHLRFYARVRGIPDIEHNVRQVIRAVGLEAFQDRQAHALSGGNKRKLSLGIALMGNPTVVLLDEPSSGLDAAAKRIMWRTLAATVAGRSILLTTHSMEEADALAGRAGILAKRMLAMGSTDQLRARFGDSLHVHIVCQGAPRTSDADVARVADWVRTTFPGADLEGKTYHGQMRFSVPASKVTTLGHSRRDVPTATDGDDEKPNLKHASREEMVEVGGAASASATQSAIGRLVVTLEEQRHALGIAHYSVSPTTLDQVFLAVVGRHNIQEEGYEQKADKKKWWRFGK